MKVSTEIHKTIAASPQNIDDQEVVETKTRKTIVLSDEELNALENIEKERRKECDRQKSCVDCPFLETFFCRSFVRCEIETLVKNSCAIILEYEGEDEQ